MKKILFCFFTSIAAVSLHGQVSLAATAGTTTGTYTTLKDAFDAINAGTHQGAITLSITGNTTETATASLNASGGASSYTSVLIKPATGVTATISGSIATALIKINGADNVTVDGSNNGTSTRNLTLTNTYTATGATPVIAWVASTTTDGSENVSFKNTNITGITSSGTVVGILVGGSVLGGAAEVSNNNFSSVNNAFTKAQNGIFAIGNATITDTGFIINNNVFGSTVTADKMGFRGIAVQNAKNFVVSGNTIGGVTLASTSLATGILVGAASTNGSVYNNKISDISNTNTLGYGAVGLFFNCASTAANIIAYNNIISGVKGYGYSAGGDVGDNGNGIVIGNGGGFKIYYNTVVMNANQNVSGRPAAFNVLATVTTPGAIDLRNNIFVNSQTQAGEKYAIYSGAANTVFSNINYNDYYSSGTNLGYIGSARATLADLQTGFGGNVNSINVVPAFVSATDFHLASVGNAGLDNKGTPVAEVTVDADNNPRSATTPDLGGYEFVNTVLAVQDAVKNKTSVSYYPNPVTDYLYVTDVNKIKNIEVYNTAGQRIANEEVNSTKGVINLTKSPSGVYILKVNSEKETQSIKIIKK